MGSALSMAPPGTGDAMEEVVSDSETTNQANAGDDMADEEYHEAGTNDDERSQAREEGMAVFRKQLDIKREQRKAILSRHRTEKEELEKALAIEKKSNLDMSENNKLLRELLLQNNIEIPEELKSSKEDAEVLNAIAGISEEVENLKTSNRKLRMGLVESNNSLQGAYSDMADLTAQNVEFMKTINALKEVVRVSKTMIGLREEQLTQLKNKLHEIEQTVADREATMLSTDLRQEYERQLQNIRSLRSLYEERARLAEVTRQSILRELEEQKTFTQTEVNKSNELQGKVESLEVHVSELKEAIENKSDQISANREETRGLQAEMSAVNKLFSQVLLGYKNKQDLDKLVHRLEENHGLLIQMAERENGCEASSELPKLLLELVSQVDECDDNQNSTVEKGAQPKAETNDEKGGDDISNELQTPPTNTTAEEIVENLPRVWRVLTELLSHQNTADATAVEKITTCYKSVETKSGPVLVPSVSQTYIRLKDLIVEKLALIKEVSRMKQLNTHLESRLGEQEKKLSVVTTELGKTWHVVGRLRRHHHQLHTHEKILKYELQQKRKLLNELKEELEYCREKWDQAREKNSQSEKEWKKLRAEFSSRKTKPILESFNTSAESGYSDERPSDDSTDSNDESGDQPLARIKKKVKKSFETIFDSSTDVNVAEREDPASDLLDVADLPLDMHDGDLSKESSSISESCKSDDVSKSGNACVETEDEAGDIGNEACLEEHQPVVENNDNDTTSSKEVPGMKEIPVIDTAAIMESIRKQNERLALKEQTLESLEKGSDALVKKVQGTVNFGDQLNNTLDHLLNRPSTSRSGISDKDSRNEQSLPVASINDEPANSVNGNNEVDKIAYNNEKTDSVAILSCDTDESISSTSVAQTSSIKSTPEIELKAILDIIQKQNERLAKNKERLKQLEDGCSDVVTTLSNTLDTDKKILQTLHTDENSEDNANSIKETDEPLKGNNHEGHADNTHGNVDNLGTDETSEVSVTDESAVLGDVQPSTSTNEHESRFAARDIRLKRLEEQTKSLVRKVNKTTSKGVKINYKLEELHNIYGSESSRAGTPSEGNDDASDDDDDDDDSKKSNE